MTRLRSYLAALLALALPPMPALASVESPPGMTPNASSATLPAARTNLGISIYTPTDYGAKCDSNGTTGTDDSTAINAMFTAIRTANVPFRVTSPQNKTCFIGSSINATGLGNLARGSTVELHLDCATNGTPCIDALSSRWITWASLYIHGEASNAPSYGIQIGRISAANADLHHFNRPVIFGSFTKAPFYNFASETVTVVNPFFSNDNTTGTSYALIQDGYNHFNITSAFVTQTLATDTPQSFNEDTFIGGWFSASGSTGYPIWLGNTSRHKWVGSYAASSAPNCVQMYQTGGQANSFLDMDLHCETTAVTDIFLLTGPQTSPDIRGFRYRDHSPQPSNSVFKTDTGIVSVTARDIDVRIGGFDNGGGNSVKLFDNAALWTVSGHIMLPNIANWTVPATFTGEICTFLTCTPANTAVTAGTYGSANQVPSFTVDAQGRLTAAANGAVPGVAQLFTSSGTYTPTAGRTVARVVACGGGGGGGGGPRELSNVAASGGGGGGGGACFDFTYRISDLGSSKTVTIGAGGAGGIAAAGSTTAGGNGGAGAVTCFGGTVASNSLICGRGGGFGAGGQLAATASGGGGGGTLNFSGGNAAGASGGGGNALGVSAGGSGVAAAFVPNTYAGGGGGGTSAAGVAGAGGGVLAIACPGGGSGGGLTAVSASNNGAGAGFNYGAAGSNTTQAAGGTSGTPNGGSIAAAFAYSPGFGGGGGYGNGSGAGGAGGAGTNCGGGGGGGAAVNGTAPGAGGAGGAGFLVVFEY